MRKTTHRRNCHGAAWVTSQDRKTLYLPHAKKIPYAVGPTVESFREGIQAIIDRRNKVIRL